MENDVVNVLWSPGSYGNSDCMEWFDNDKKWKADYSMHWLIEILLPKIEQDINNKKRKLIISLKNQFRREAVYVDSKRKLDGAAEKGRTAGPAAEAI